MNKQQSERLIERLIERVASNTSDAFEASIEEPASFFLDEQRWQRERQAFFFNTPQVIGFAGELAMPGSYMTAVSMGVPIVATRNEEGQLRAFINACAHKGACVATGCGSAKRLTCGFHGWSYDLSGRLAGRPQDKHFSTPKEQSGLIPLPVSDSSGLIIVGLRPDIDQQIVDHALDDIAPVLAGFDLDKVGTLASDRFEVAANWKLIVSLSLESYHFGTLHRESLAPMMTSHAVIDEFGPHTRWSFPLRGIEKLTEQDRSDWPVRPPAAISHIISPGTVVIINPGDAQFIRVEPGSSPGHSVVYFHGVCDRASDAGQSLQTYEFGRKIFEDEDLPAAEQCQQGIAAGLSSVVIGSNEPVVQMWHKRWHQGVSLEAQSIDEVT